MTVLERRLLSVTVVSFQLLDAVCLYFLFGHGFYLFLAAEEEKKEMELLLSRNFCFTILR